MVADTIDDSYVFADTVDDSYVFADTVDDSYMCELHYYDISYVKHDCLLLSLKKLFERLNF